MKSLIKVEWIQIWRNWPVFIMAVGMPVAFFLFFSSSVDLSSPEMNRKFVQGYVLTMTSFSMSSFALFSLPIMLNEDKNNHYLTYVEHSPLGIGSYYISKLFRVMIYFLVSILATFFVGIFFRGVDISWYRGLFSVILLIVTSFVYLAIGLLIAQIQNQQIMSITSNIVFMGLAVIGGSWWPISMFPSWVQNISKITPSYHVNQIVTNFASSGVLGVKSLLIVMAYVIIITSFAITIKKKREVK